MRKTLIGERVNVGAVPEYHWLDLEKLAEVEMTSEADAFPIESALKPEGGVGWRAAAAGEQTVRLLFAAPLRVRHIRLVFSESEQSRTQEFLLRWSNDQGATFREIVRQQYNFSPPGSTREVEDYHVDLPGVTELELRIVPDIDGGSARASIAQFLVAD